MPIKTIIFDFGNVVAFFDHGRALERLAAHTVTPAPQLRAALYDGHLEDAFERSGIDTAGYVTQALVAGKLACTPEQFLEAFVAIFWRNPEVCDLIPRLRPKYRVILASNTNAAHFDHYVKQFATELAHFDFLGTSFDARARKPEPEFFAHIQRHANAEPHECLFLDDLPKNVMAAEHFGWQGIVYQADGTLADKLRAAGVEIGTK
jgi:glucose-1-phosphatase